MLLEEFSKNQLGADIIMDNTFDENGQVVLLVYGSLRHGQYNHKRFGLSSGNTYTIPGYYLVPLHGNAYPGAIASKDDKDKVVVEAIPAYYDTAKRIALMELYAGYKAVRVEYAPKKFGMLFEYSEPANPNHIKISDWIQFLKNGETSENKATTPKIKKNIKPL